MKHRKIPKSDRHKKIKSVNQLQEINVINDNVVKNNFNQSVPRKLQEILDAKKESNNATKMKKKKKNKFLTNGLVTIVKPSEKFEIEPGMTRKPKPLPEMVIKDLNESNHHFMNRLNKMISQSMAEANLEEHFDLDLGDQIPIDKMDSKQNRLLSANDDNDNNDPQQQKKQQRKKEKNRQNLLRRKARKLGKQHRLIKQLNKNIDDHHHHHNDKDFVKFGEVVHCPPNFEQLFKKRKK
ncbi:hypothetical protein DERP_004661 [Dermatophagoides pteronyssinus]|uniref:Uncharacterized protein n=2 Tax=Dermatophagoides pteronyssinus TaxID=6956 RepID=A0ABQ8JPD6_DERPT|nr:myb-like protein X [Dermatophagoides pteronyssinus]KAH9424476.1 hypothetical protein DERP_004661 [Dermatophagoides pteronyssinus]